MPLPCPYCGGDPHPVLGTITVKGRDKTAAKVYKVLSWSLRVRRNETYHKALDSFKQLYLYGYSHATHLPSLSPRPDQRP